MWVEYSLVAALGFWFLLGVIELVHKFIKSRQDRPGVVTNIELEKIE